VGPTADTSYETWLGYLGWPPRRAWLSTDTPGPREVAPDSATPAVYWLDTAGRYSQRLDTDGHGLGADSGELDPGPFFSDSNHTTTRSTAVSETGSSSGPE